MDLNLRCKRVPNSIKNDAFVQNCCQLPECRDAGPRFGLNELDFVDVFEEFGSAGGWGELDINVIMKSDDQLLRLILHNIGCGGREEVGVEDELKEEGECGDAVGLGWGETYINVIMKSDD